MAKSSATLGWNLISVVCVYRGESEVPHDTVESCDAQKIPFGGHPTPKLK